MEKAVKSTSSLTRHINICKIPITLPSRQSSIPVLILEYNMTNHLALTLDNLEEDISQEALNNNEEEFKPADITGNDNEIANLWI